MQGRRFTANSSSMAVKVLNGHRTTADWRTFTIQFPLEELAFFFGPIKVGFRY